MHYVYICIMYLCICMKCFKLKYCGKYMLIKQFTP